MNEFEPQRSDYVDAVRTLHDSATLSIEMGIDLEDIRPGLVAAGLPLRRKVTQQHGYAHAGALATLADVVCGLAAYSLMPADSSILSINLNLSLLQPANGERVRAVGRVIKAGKRVYFTEADLYSVVGTGEKLVARATATMSAASAT